MIKPDPPLRDAVERKLRKALEKARAPLERATAEEMPMALAEFERALAAFTTPYTSSRSGFSRQFGFPDSSFRPPRDTNRWTWYQSDTLG